MGCAKALRLQHGVVKEQERGHCDSNKGLVITTWRKGENIVLCGEEDKYENFQYWANLCLF